MQDSLAFRPGTRSEVIQMLEEGSSGEWLFYIRSWIMSKLGHKMANIIGCDHEWERRVGQSGCLAARCGICNAERDALEQMAARFPDLFPNFNCIST